jgi:hypothetical protein
LGPGTFQPKAVPIGDAQATPVLKLPAFLSADEMSELRAYGDAAIEAGSTGMETRSAASQGDHSWKVAFLHTAGRFEEDGWGWLIQRAKERVAAEAERGWEGVVAPDEIEALNVRCVEFHSQVAPGPGINDFRHCKRRFWGVRANTPVQGGFRRVSPRRSRAGLASFAKGHPRQPPHLTASANSPTSRQTTWIASSPLICF